MVNEKEKKQCLCLNNFFSVDQPVTCNSKLAGSSSIGGGGKMGTRWSERVKEQPRPGIF